MSITIHSPQTRVAGRLHAISDGPQSQHTNGALCERPVQSWLNANGSALDTLIGLVERGPLADGDVPSKAGRTALLERGLAVRTVVNGEEGYQAATMAGVAAYRALYGADTIAEAMKARKALK